MVVIQSLKAYSVTDGELSFLVYAANRGEAKSIAHGDEHFCDTPWTELSAKRQRLADQWANDGPPRIDDDPDHMRDLGWYPYDIGGLDCRQCGLYDWSDGTDDEQVVCDQCQHCGGCGHDDGCLLALAFTLFDHGDPLVFDPGMIAEDYACHWLRHPRT